VLAELLSGGDEHAQIALQGADRALRDDEVRPLDPRLGDVAAEQALRHDLGRDRERLPADRRLDDAKTVVERVEPGLETGRQPDQPLTAEPQLQLDRPPGPGLGDARLGGQPDRRLDDRPEVPGAKVVSRTPGRERPLGDRVFGGVAPGAQPVDSLERALDAEPIDRVGQRRGHRSPLSTSRRSWPRHDHGRPIGIRRLDRRRRPEAGRRPVT
jgi:hypothetical protein